MKQESGSEIRKTDPKKSANISNVLTFINNNNTFFVFILLLVISMILSPNFFTLQNITNLMRQNAPLCIASLGMLIVILTGGIDLSIGAIVTLSGIMFTVLMQSGQSFISALFWALISGLLCGVISGFLVAYQNLAPFVVTLAVMSMAKGVAYIVSKGLSISVENADFLLFSRMYIGGIPSQFLLMIGIFAIVIIIFHKMSYGRIIYAIGSNEQAVRLSGLRVNRYKFSVYCVCALLASVAGVLMTGRMGVGSPIVGEGMEMDAIAGAVLGGASLAGGKGSIVKTIFGVYTLGMISNIMNLMQVPAYPQQVIKGVIIIAAILLQKYSGGQKRSHL
jgi:ribose transport system permease protein